MSSDGSDLACRVPEVPGAAPPLQRVVLELPAPPADAASEVVTLGNGGIGH